MGIMSWDLDGSGFNKPLRVRTPHLTIRCEYPDTRLTPTEVSFSLSPRYGINHASEAHDWFLKMMAENDEFEVMTDRAEEWPVPFSSPLSNRLQPGCDGGLREGVLPELLPDKTKLAGFSRSPRDMEVPGKVLYYGLSRT